jgi:nitroreductase
MAIQISNQILSVKEAIESRRNIRKFVRKSITKEEIKQIFALARLTPSAWNIPP